MSLDAAFEMNALLMCFPLLHCTRHSLHLYLSQEEKRFIRLNLRMQVYGFNP